MVLIKAAPFDGLTALFYRTPQEHLNGMWKIVKALPSSPPPRYVVGTRSEPLSYTYPRLRARAHAQTCPCARLPRMDARLRRNRVRNAPQRARGGFSARAVRSIGSRPGQIKVVTPGLCGTSSDAFESDFDVDVDVDRVSLR